MQTSKFLFVLGAVVAVILPLQVQAGPDNDEQAKMRAALRQKMEELNAPKGENPVAPPVTPAAAEPAPKPQPAPVVNPAPAPAPPPPAPVAAPQTQVVPVPVAPVQEQPVVTTPLRPVDPNAEAMREALRKKLAESQTSPTPATLPASPTTPPVIAPIAATSATPIVPPASPLSGSKEARLAELLARYKSDTITALEYHTQRAAILAGQ